MLEVLGLLLGTPGGWHLMCTVAVQGKAVRGPVPTHLDALQPQLLGRPSRGGADGKSLRTHKLNDQQPPQLSSQQRPTLMRCRPSFSAARAEVEPMQAIDMP